ncbi:MAG: hypothetical protein DRR16_17780 [Candidatus Parabeggiatoa sp. nov. 3]|nr:MAG: hypothetical protein DRR00_07995 [Gammaproteobacteria bacterium]RKZ66106.1 MAG: hypothetical protein DRQ99_10750 [Gammaproteobacteria bacterium]RKZ83235.1 MAG: hypothetical protein DRR16_17780 [Gammaproteobacteria bacterium]
MKRFTFLPLMFTVWFTMSIINTASAGLESGLSIVFWFFVIFVVSCLIVIGVVFGLIAFFKWLFRSIQSKIKPKTRSLLWVLWVLLLVFLLIAYVISVIVLLVKHLGVILSSVIIFIIIFLFYMLTRDDDSINYPMPNLTALNPFEIAALRDGRKGIIQTALFNLCHLKELFMFKAIKDLNLM